MTFIENNAEYLLRRIPSDIKADHYHDDGVHIRQILEASGLVLKGGMDLAAATIRGLTLFFALGFSVMMVLDVVLG